MARLASSLEGRHPVPPADDPTVAAVLPSATDIAVVATDDDQRLLCATWCHAHVPALVLDDNGAALHEVIVAVTSAARGEGVGGALLDRVAAVARRHNVAALALNVHLLNPAVRLYIRMGFRVAGRGRGWYSVAMTSILDDTNS